MSKIIKLKNGKYEKKNSYVFASIDPGVKNCGILIEKINIDRNGSNVNICKIKKLYYNLVNFTKYNSFTNIYINTSNFLDSISNYLDICDFFVIEFQLKKNFKASRLYQFFVSYIIIKYKNENKIIIELDSCLKSNIFSKESLDFTFDMTNGNFTQYLNLIKDRIEKMKKTKTTKKIKIQSCISCAKILIYENDGESLQFISTLSKLDDVSDVLCQLRAFYNSTIFYSLIF